MTNEIISLHVGHAGVHTGSSIWNLLCKEHGLLETGYMCRSEPPWDNSGIDVMFQALTAEKYFARSIFLDSDQRAMNEIRNGPQSQLFRQDSFEFGSGQQGEELLYSVGNRGLGNALVVHTMDKIRRMSEHGDAATGFFFTHSMSGGTGSGLTAKLLVDLKEEYVKAPQVQLTIFPQQVLDSPESLFALNNIGLMLKDTVSDLRTVILTDNDALARAINTCSFRKKADMNSVNRVIAHVASAVTLCSRFKGSSALDLNEMENHLVPTRLMRYSTASFTPFCKGCAVHGTFPGKMGTLDVTRGCFLPSLQLFSFSPLHFPTIASSIVYRGKVNHKEINSALGQMVKSFGIRFGKGMPVGFKIGVAEGAPSLVPFENLSRVPRSSAMFNNTTALLPAFSFIKESLEELIRRKTVTNYYLRTGIEEQDFTDALDNLHNLIFEYQSSQ